MHYSRLFLVWLALFLLLSGCNEEGDFRQNVPQKVLDTTDKMLDALIAGETRTAQLLLLPELLQSGGGKLVSDAEKALKASPVVSEKPYEVVSYNVTGEIFGSHQELTYQLKRGQGYVLVHFGVDEIYKRYYKVTTIEYRFLPLPLQELNAFTFKGKPWQHYAVIACGAILILLVLGSLIMLLRTKTRKPWIWWFWCFIICIGFVRISFNWTSGQFTFAPVGGVGAQILHHLGWVVNVIHVSRYEPWYIQLMFPLGALLFLWRRKSLEKRAEEAKNPSSE